MAEQIPAVRRIDPIQPSPAMGQEEESPSMLKQVHALLRGRYHWAALIGLIGLIGGVVGGWQMASNPAYKSTGIIQFRAVLPRILYETDVTQMMPTFTSFVQSQVELMKSPRVINKAMEDAAWTSLGRGYSEREVIEFMSHLNVSASKGGEFVYVGYTDPEAKVASAAVGSVIRAYEALYKEWDTKNEENRNTVLQARQSSLDSELKSLRQRVVDLAQQYGTTSLEDPYSFKVSELQKVEAQLHEAETLLAQMPQDTAPGAEAATEPAASAAAPSDAQAHAASLTQDQLAQRDPVLRELLDQRLNHKASIEQAALTAGENHKSMIRLRTTEAQIERRIDDRIAQVRQLIAENPGGGIGGGELIGRPQLVQRRDALQKLHDSLSKEVLAMGKVKLEIDKLKDDARVVEARLDETNQRLEVLNFESQSRLANRMEVVGYGEYVLPTGDSRKRTAGMVGVAGMGLGIGLIALLGFVDKRLQVPEDAQGSFGRATILGVLPELPQDLADAEQAAMAAHAVHQIRATLQIGIDRHHSRVLAFTSAQAQDGKTSLCMALGLSFAETGLRTLLIDCDLATGTLSRRAQAIVRRKIGQIFLREGLITHEHLEEALTVATSTRRPVGEVMVALGYLTQEQLDRALSIQEASSLGLNEVLMGERIEHCVSEMGTPNLYVLPVGAAGGQHAGRFSSEKLRELLRQARDKFDLVLVDTGPILGSLESALVAVEADANVVVVSRGAQRPMVRRALDRLSELRATVAGVVFNRADTRHFARYTALSSTISRPMEPRQLDSPTAATRARFGPMVTALTNAPAGAYGTPQPAADSAKVHTRSSQVNN